MSDLMAQLKAMTETPAVAKNTKPIGYANIEFAGVNIFSRPVWKESTSDTGFVNELNDLMREDPKAAEKVLKKILAKVTVTVTTRQSNNSSLLDLLK